VQANIWHSKNQVAHTIILEEKEFRTRDISTQVFAIFDKTSKDRGIHLKVDFEGTNDANNLDNPAPDGRRLYGPFGTGRVKDMVLWGDKTRILQVIINLTSNALKFTPEGGNVQVVVRCVGEVDLSRKGSKASFASRHGSGRNSRSRFHSGSSDVSDSDRSIRGRGVSVTPRAQSPPPGTRDLTFEFEVQDSGPGIAEDLQEKIFEPFFQGDMQLSKKYSGTGLGLSICKQLATLMHGTIFMRSEEGQGSTFIMRIPLKHIATRSGSASSSVSGGQQSPRPSIDEQMPPGLLRDDMSTHSFPSPSVTSAPFESDSQPRLVGLSAPFFASGAETSEPEKLGGRKLRVLIAEDNKTNQMVVLRMLRIEKIFNVDVAEGELHEKHLAYSC
jgi:osomolarity two-component system sensor histidine kinase SLN1